jgi:predicted nucleotidyltransferase
MINAYASAFVSYLVASLKENISSVDNIILYGSVARNEAEEVSDVDIFVDSNKKIDKEIEKTVSDFRSTKQFLWFKANGIQNEIRVKSGKLANWKELHRSISSNGIILWSHFEPKEKPIGTKHKIIFYWNEIGKNRGAFLNKLYGFRANGKKYAGLLEKWGGFRMGKSCVIIPIKHKSEMTEFLKSYKVNAKNMEVFSME